MNITSLLSHWRADPTVGGNLTAWETMPARQASYAPLPETLHPWLRQALNEEGIQQLYTHQAQAWQCLQAGDHIALATDTASGKTLAYNLPILNSLLHNRQARALYLFPTKALAQDQLAGVERLLKTAKEPSLFIYPGSYDGDTPRNTRVAMRSKSRLIISNPDMLHFGILPHHTNWAEFFGSLRYILLDEMHIYRGVFGSHVANVIRRLKRIAHFYGARPQFVLTSATIGNPAELAQRLTEEPVTLIEQDGSGRGPKHFLIYNPPLIDPELGLRASMLGESVRLAADLLSYDIQTILFGRTRRTVEVLLKYLRQAVPLQAAQVRAYRSGYLPKLRREIESGLRTGKTRCVVATTALELGIDIGGMGATLQAGYPGTIAGTWQQAGRAGRGLEASISVLVTSPSPADQYLARHPEYFFERSPEHALVNPDNLLILLQHLQCAAFEIPFKDGENFGDLTPTEVAAFLNILHKNGVLHKSQDRFFWMGDTYPAAEISLRSASTQPYLLHNTATHPPEIFGSVDSEAALWMVHPGAVYLHEGESFVVEELDLERHLVQLSPQETDYFTRPRQESDVQLIELGKAQRCKGGSKAFGEIGVTTTVTGYQMIRWESHEKIGQRPLELPPTQLLTSGYWLSVSEESVDHLRADGLWSNAPNNYGPGWRKQRLAALERDQYRCQSCGVSAEHTQLHVHHKEPLRAFSSYLEANRLENLVSLCPSCHRRAESRVRIRSGLAGLAYAFHHLAPLFLMCDPRDLGVHTEAQSPLGEGKPVVAIYEMIPAGIGFSQRLFEFHNALIERAGEVVANCPCADGCPSCVGPGGEAGAGGKPETFALIEQLR